MSTITISSQKGTSSIEIESKAPVWAGSSYREFQEEKFSSLPEKKVLSRAKGTGAVLAKEYPSISKLASHKGLAVVTGRGTGIRYL